MYNICIAGLGKISKKHIIAINSIKEFNLHSVCDINKQNYLKLNNKSIKYYKNYKEALNDRNIDIMDICTPSGLHPVMVIQAAQQKKNIIVEKPLALVTRDGMKAVEAAKKNKVKLFVVRQNRYNVPVMALKQAIQEKRFGKIFYAKTSIFWHRDQNYYNQAGWRGTKNMDGGVLMNQASHHIDLLQWLVGSVSSVSAKAKTVLHKIEAEDMSVVIMEFKNGAYGMIEATTCTAPKDIEGELIIMGSKGTVVLGGFTGEKLKIWQFKKELIKDRNIRKKQAKNPDTYAYTHIQYFTNVLEVLKKKSRPISDGMEELKTTKLMEAIYQSIEKKKVIFL